MEATVGLISDLSFVNLGTWLKTVLETDPRVKEEMRWSLIHVHVWVLSEEHNRFLEQTEWSVKLLILLLPFCCWASPRWPHITRSFTYTQIGTPLRPLVSHTTAPPPHWLLYKNKPSQGRWNYTDYPLSTPSAGHSHLFCFQKVSWPAGSPSFAYSLYIMAF